MVRSRNMQRHYQSKHSYVGTGTSTGVRMAMGVSGFMGSVISQDITDGMNKLLTKPQQAANIKSKD